MMGNVGGQNEESQKRVSCGMTRVWLEQVERNTAIFDFAKKKKEKKRKKKKSTLEMYRTAKNYPTFLITRGPTNNHSIDFENATVIDKGDHRAKES